MNHIRLMNHRRLTLIAACLSFSFVLGMSFLLTGCTAKVHADARVEAPSVSQVENETDSSSFKVENASSFPWSRRASTTRHRS